MHFGVDPLSDRRFVGDSAVLLNSELRGSIFDGTQLRLDGWRVDYGIGFRLIWSLVPTVSFDHGISSEGQVFHMDLGCAF